MGFWRELADGEIEFTMPRLRIADKAAYHDRSRQYICGLSARNL